MHYIRAVRSYLNEKRNAAKRADDGSTLLFIWHDKQRSDGTFENFTHVNTINEHWLARIRCLPNKLQFMLTIVNTSANYN